MTWPVLDTFSDANGTLLSGTGVAVNGSGHTDRVSDSGSKLYVSAGTISAFGQYEVQNGAVYRKTTGAGGTAFMIYLDDPGAVQTDQVTAVYKCYTNIQTYIALTIHRYWQLRYYFANSGAFSSGNWYVVNTVGGAVVGSNSDTTVVSGSASFSDAGRFTFGSAGTPVTNTVSYKLSGTNPASTGFTLEVVVNGTTLGWSLNFTTTYPAGNQYPVGWAIEGNAVATSGSQTGIHMDSFTYGAGVTPADAAEITGPAVVGVGIATPADYTVRSLVGGTDAGVFRLTFLDYGAVLGTDATFALSDGSSGTFSGTNVASNVLTIPDGDTSGTFTYTPASAGSKTITATPGGGASAFTPPTFSVVATNKIIMLDGDSRTDYRSGNSSSVISAPNLVKWPVLLQERLGTTAAVYDFAASGQAVSDQITDFSSEIGAKITAAIAAGATVYFVHWGAGNGVSGISSANPSHTTTQVGETIASQISTLCTSARNLDAKVIVFTDARRKNNTGESAGFATWQGSRNEASFNAAVDACNAKIRTDWTQYADAIIDWGSDGRNLTPLYTGGIFEDGTHLYPFNNTTDTHAKAAGSSDVAQSVFTTFKALELGSGEAGSGGSSYVFGS